MRSMWNGSISFGLVNIPVGMYPATKENQIGFHLLHKKDCGRIRNQRVCSECGEVLDYDDIVKGFEYEKGEYVTVTDAELKQAKPESTETIAIKGFVDLEDIDPIYFDNPYYLVPDRKSDRVYALLREALKQTGKVGIASFVLRSKEYLAAVRPHGDALVLNTMHYADEVRAVEDAPPEDTKVPEREMDMAVQLIEAMGDEFEPEQYKDTYNEALLALIDKKLHGKKLPTKTVKKEPTNVLDLMSRLKASLEGAGVHADGEEAGEGRKAKSKTGASRSSGTRSSASRGSASGKPAAGRTSGAKKAPAKKTAAAKTTSGTSAKKPQIKLLKGGKRAA